MELRPYQEEAIKSIRKNFEKGTNKQVIVLATGTGKTIIFAHLISQLIKETGKKALIIAHREELLKQAQDKLEKVDPSLKTGIEQAEKKITNGVDVIIASVPTLGRKNSTRIQKFDPKEFCIAVTDEAHHASANTYKEVFRNFGVLKGEEDWNKDLLLLGVTATPSRNDNKGIDKIFDKVTYNYGIIPAIEDGWLCRIKAFRVDTKTDLKGVKKIAGDFSLGELAERVNNEDRNGLVVSAYNEIIPDQKALLFAVDVEHTLALYNRFKEEGIKTGYVIGGMPTKKREQMLREFSNGDINVMVNCMVLTEGFDEPSIEAILMARPTQSGLLFQQMIGRGTRLYPNKEHLTIIDFTDNTYRQTLQTTASLLGLEDAIDFQGKDILHLKEKLERLKELVPDSDLSGLDINKIDYEIEEVDILSGLQIPAEIAIYTSYDWHRFSKDNYRIGLGNHQWLEIIYNIAGEHSVSEHQYNTETKKESAKALGSKPTLKDAVEASDKYIMKQFPNRIRLISETAEWRNDPVSIPQVELLEKMGVNTDVIKTLSKGRAARLITKLLNKRTQKKKYQRLINPYSGKWYTKKIR